MADDRGEDGDGDGGDGGNDVFLVINNTGVMFDFDAIPIGAGSSADVDVEIDDEEMAAPKRRVAPRNGTWRLR